MFRLGHLVVALSEAWLVPVFLIFLHKEISSNPLLVKSLFAGLSPNVLCHHSGMGTKSVLHIPGGA